jgi:DNA-binding MarR family transcriptional regulator
MVTPPTTLDPAQLDAAAPALNDGHDEALAFVTRALDETPRRIDGVDRASMELILLLHRVTNVVVYDLESRVHRPAGWSWAAFRAVFTLWNSGPLEPSRLAETSGMSRQAVSSLVKTLEADGLIARSAAEHDARSVVLTLTPLGTRKIVQVFHEHNVREADWAATLDADERETMTRLLRKLASAAQQDWVSHRF